MNDKIIPFPSKPAFFARCPRCNGFQWEIEVDKPTVEKIKAFHCASPGCGFVIPLIMNIELTEGAANTFIKIRS